MHSSTLKCSVMFGAAVAVALIANMAQAGVPGQGTWETTLQQRDLNGDRVADAFYDTDLKVTWLRDANVFGEMNWPTATSWAAAQTFGGYSDWRLPTSDTCQDYNCTASEMGHMWYMALGNLAGGPMTNTGGFQNLQSSYYWSGSNMFSPGYAYAFQTAVGFQGGGNYSDAMFAMAVHPGDVGAPVPEPQTHALLLLGLTGLALKLRRRPG